MDVDGEMDGGIIDGEMNDPVDNEEEYENMTHELADVGLWITRIEMSSLTLRTNKF